MTAEDESGSRRSGGAPQRRTAPELTPPSFPFVRVERRLTAAQAVFPPRLLPVSFDGHVRAYQTLTVQSHRLGSLLQDAAVAKLCEQLNQTETVFPTTGLRPIYRQVGST